ncbi:DUF1834 family protein [Paraburkholderia unamae]|uniref:Phage gp37-like protein n=1 Tax=Paraburkholderia unamae TaxID=219649 RepID=A0ABX5KKN6_9BURK|nr:DUF1834 family protein [Paraburkholderia unamae]PVX80051.1 phage gp37-like protein [Paraburkholderia unamae]
MVTPVPIITAVENAMVDRLKRGLGQMVRQVSTYGGEFDDDGLADVVRNLPAAWVTFGGVRKTSAVDARRKSWKAEGTFIVMVGAYSVRSEAASRQGGARMGEVGTNMLIWAVRRLLAQQDLSLPIQEFAPGAVRTLFNTKLQRDAFSVFALEFHTAWIEHALAGHAFPQPVDPATVVASDPTCGLDALFALYKGQLDPATPDLTAVELNTFVNGAPESGLPLAQDIVTLPPSQESK